MSKSNQNIRCFQVSELRINIFLASLCTNLDEPNQNANLVDLALPGMLPVLNENCLNQAIKASIALNGRILPRIRFDRKHY